MILRSLILENFGLYGGRTVFDLAPAAGPDGARPVVLVGGRNGAGKTTFLEAVRLALYGQRALGARVGRAEYEAYLAGRVHKTFGPGPHPPGALGPTAVELAFDYAEAGVVHRYSVRREWRAGGGARGRESLRLEKDGRPVDAVPRDEWHGFLQELVPPGVSQLFFFDGEKVQEMADAGDDASSLVEAVRGLLGIETISRLRTDLGFYIARHRRHDGRPDAAASELEAVERELGALVEETEAAVGDEAELVTRKEAHARVLDRARQRFVQEGGELAERRGALECERDRLAHRLSQAESELRELANGLMPLAVAPRVMARFEAAVEGRLRAGMDASNPSARRKDLAEAVAAWRATTAPVRTARWTEGHWRDLALFVDALGDPREDGRADPRLDGLGDLPGLRDQLVQARTVTRTAAAAIAAELDDLAEASRAVEGQLERANGFAASSALLMEEVKEAERGFAETETALGAASERVKALRYRAAALAKRRGALLEAGEANAVRDRRTALAGRAGEALAVYEGRLMARKVARLEDEFARAFRELARKDDLVDRAIVDPGTFQVRLVDRDGREVPKASLSAGERQIFAVSLLWALARVSGRPLPMIIDTPLARLDGEHRDRLVDRYFPAASHQVILLSTDEEIQGRLLRRLEPSVSHSYRLDYDPAQGRTVLRPGYLEDGSTAPLGVSGRVRETGDAVRAVHQA